MMTKELQVTIASGQTLSGYQSVGFNDIFALEVPTITTATLYIQASMDGKTFRRVLKADGSGDWNIASSTGNRMIFLDEIAPFNFVRVESSASQGADRLFKFWIKE